MTFLLPVSFVAACAVDQGERYGATTAALECEGWCPTYVDPGAAEEGDGSSWQAPLRSVQAAIDAQYARGGGEVWVRAGGPYAALMGDPTTTLIQLRSGVHLLGGFGGGEETKDDRDLAARTLIAGAASSDATENAPLVVGETDVTLDGFSIDQHNGPALVIRDAADVHVQNVTITNSYVDKAGLIDVANSEVHFEAVHVTDSTTARGVPGVLAVGSTLRFTDAEFARLRAEAGGAAGILATDSTVVLDEVRFIENDSRQAGRSAGLHATNGDVLVTNSVWSRNRGDRGSLWAISSNLVVVNSHFERNSHIGSTAMIEDSDSTFLNASFVDNRAFASGAINARNGQLRVVNATFVDNLMTYPKRSAYPDDISVAGLAQLELSNSFSNRGQYSVYAPYTGSGNCLIEADAYREATDAGLTKALLYSEFGCTDTGVDAAASATTTSASEFAATLGATIPLGTAWWQASSSTVDVASDANAIDPGRHYTVGE